MTWTPKTDGAEVVPMRLYDHGFSGTSDFVADHANATALGDVLSHAVVGFEREVEFVYKQTAGRHPVDLRWLGDVITLEVVLAARSSAVLKLINRPVWASTNSGLLVGTQQLKPGQRVKLNSKTTRLQIAAMADDYSARNLNKPHLYIPYAFCMKIGPRQWNQHGKLLEATVATIIALWDETNLVNGYEGDPSVFPALT